ncbi:hypothetical protein VNI00_015083 [Paramarasmius palmivorus]|uniref:Carboxylesterase type B domain-containing protein n=1 Tax=Paramarasmius palmivorus TaxID=297713 RepID=A0AAW0BN00_9AGAR
MERLYGQVAEFAGCNTSEDTLSCLRGVNASTLALAGAKTLQARGSTLYAFAPCMDGELITMRPVEAFGSGKFARVNVLFGSNTNEGANWSNSLPSAAANTSMPNATETTVYNFIRGQYAPFTNSSFAQGLELYPNATYNASMSMQGQQMYGEARYICSASLIGSGVASVGNRAWVYRYNNPNMGSNHGSEIQAMWGTPSAKATAQDKELFSRMREYWTSFVTGGDPVSSNVTWEEFGEGRRLLLDPSGIQMEDIPSEQAERCAFWHGISEELNT